MAALTLPASAQTLMGKVVAVADGDTVTLLDGNKRQHKIRLSGIDAPENKQPFGQRAKQSLSDLVYAKNVVVHTTKTDRYGRSIGRIELGDVDVNLAQLRRGMAWHYTAYESEQASAERRIYRDAEAQARAGKTGLWRDPLPVPPWSFRQQTRAAWAFP